VGLADPQALVLAEAAVSVTEMIGLPEARIPLAEAAVYVACAPKSNAVYCGIDAALEEVRQGQLQRVPLFLKDASYSGAQKIGHGQGYLYPHDYPDGIVDQRYMEQPKKFYEPKESGYEQKIKDRLERWARLKKKDES
jgi:putative ATPase